MAATKGNMTVYAFDIDETLWFSPAPGPITYEMVKAVKDAGHVVGLLGQWAHNRALDREPRWHALFSFVGMVPWSNNKHLFMAEWKQYVAADDYVMVGNRPQDEICAQLGGWRFVGEAEFANGMR